MQRPLKFFQNRANLIANVLRNFSSPESAFLLVSTKNTDSGHFQGRKSANYGLPGSSTHAQKFETTVVVNGYKIGPSLRLRISWKWPESVFLVLTKRKAGSGDEIETDLKGIP